jgi:aspartyl-tRNA(Asn)/glutamyl-tRNA(Gln) amidotransferase subunit A
MNLVFKRRVCDRQTLTSCFFRYNCSKAHKNAVNDLLDTSIILSSREQSLLGLTLTEAAEWLSARKTTATELVETCLKQHQRTKNLNAYITVTEERAREKARVIDSNIDAETQRSKRPLLGIPIAVKDTFCMKNVRTTAASKMLKDFVPPYDSTVTERLEAAGAIILGKTNMDEFAMGSATIFSEFGATINPWSLTQKNVLYTAGGSSGGSAAALAAKTCFAAIGTDTGGSVRLPASYCGLVGLKPSYGLVSRWGVIAYASSLDTPGVIAKTVRDAALMLQVIAGPDEKDSTCLEAQYRPPLVDYVRELEQCKDLRGIRIGIPKEYNVAELSEEIRTLWSLGAEWLQKCGATIVEVSLPHTAVALSAYYIIAPAEASSNLARYDGVRFGYRCECKESDSIRELYTRTRSMGFGAEVKRRILLGTFALSRKSYESYYKKALQIRRLVQNDFEGILRLPQLSTLPLDSQNDSRDNLAQLSNEEKVDAVLTPTAPTPAFTLESAYAHDNPVLLYLNDVMTIPANMAGIPAISVPIAFSKEGLPIGLQLMSAALNEVTLLKIAHHLEALAKDNTSYSIKQVPW